MDGIRGLLRRAGRDEKGNVAILFALMTIVVSGVLGLSIDYGRAIDARAELQAAADAAALGAAAKSNLDTDERLELATRIFKANVADKHMLAAVEPIVSPGSGDDEGTIRVAASIAVGTSFAGIAGVRALSVDVEARAEIGSTGSEGANGPACLLALEASDYGIKINGGGTGSHLSTNCNVHVNSGSSSAIFGNDKGSIAASKICVNGSYDNSPTYSPQPIRDCERLADPLAGVLTPPATTGCNYEKTKVNANKTKTLYPGIHCDGIDIGSSADVTFEPGVYVVKNGQFKIGSSAIVRGQGVFFYLVGNNARIDFGSSAEITFRAPASGTWQGMLFWSAESLGNAHRVGSHSASIFDGTVYSPGTEFDIQCSGTIGASGDWTIWVVKQLQMSSHATLAIKSGYATSSTPTPPGLLDRLTPPTRVARLR
jgi:Flp pilus assembly protein TadG